MLPVFFGSSASISVDIQLLAASNKCFVVIMLARISICVSNNDEVFVLFSLSIGFALRRNLMIYKKIIEASKY